MFTRDRFRRVCNTYTNTHESAKGNTHNVRPHEVTLFVNVQFAGKLEKLQ